MKRWVWVGPIAAAAWVPAAAQENASASVASEKQKVYFDDRYLTPPSLIEPQTPFAEVRNCSGDYHGNIQLSLIVDAQGRPQDVIVTDPVGNDLDDLAVNVVEADRFVPGSLDGKPVAVGRKIAISLRACIVTGKDASGKKTASLHLRKSPEQKLAYASASGKDVFLDSGVNSARDSYQVEIPGEKVGGTVSAPKPILQPSARFSDYARCNKIEGTAVPTAIVDAHGLPQDVRVSRSLEPSLDEQAILAVEHYRFKPAMKDGRPVAVQVSVEVRFQFR